MRKLKGIFCIVLALAVICASCAFSLTASAADAKAETADSANNLMSNVEDGCILHALCWSYSEIEKNIPAIAAAGYTTVQTSPVQQPKDYSPSTNISGQWWKLYQPVSLALAQQSWIGTETELKSLCATAHQYGVKIICDVVTNHLGADKLPPDGESYLKLAADVKKYDTTLWNGNGKIAGNPYFHENGTGSTASDSNAYNVTQKVSSGCPDLNTSNTTVQNKVVSLLKSCIDCGVDGFRFDAAKHIEVPGDTGVSDTSYWTNVISKTNTYATSKGKTMFYYGEILNTPGNGRNITGYTNLNSGKYRVTDNSAGNSIRSAVANHNAQGASSISFPVAKGADKAVVWAESHDTYLYLETRSEQQKQQVNNNWSDNISDEDIIKAWAMVASRKDSTPIYFARTNQAMIMGGYSKNTSYKSVAVSEVNKFHNKFSGQSEKTGSSGSFAYVVRGNTGIVITNVNGTNASVNISGTGLANGSYKDMITGASFTVSNGTINGQIGSTGVAVVTQEEPTPYIFADQENQTFEGEYIVVNLTTQNATSATYQLENGTAHTFTGTKKIRIGKDYSYGDTITLNLTATNASGTTSCKYTYVKKQAAASGIYVILPKDVVESEEWTAPYYCYVYYEPNGKGTFPAYMNAAWAGEIMDYDENQQVYYIEVHSDSCILAHSNTEWQISDFDLANCTQTRVIVSDSAASVGGVSQGHQHPSGSNASGFTLDQTSKIYTLLSGRQKDSFTTTTIKPGKVVDEAGAEDVTRDGAIIPTQPTQTQPTTTQGTQETQPGETKYYGDSNLDGKVDINDVTVIQQHLIKLPELTDSLALTLADVVNDDGKVTIQDANYIQRYLAKFSNTGRVNQVYSGSSTPIHTTPTTQPPAPVNTYTLYIKTQLTWISADGAEPFIYDNATGESYQMIRDANAYPIVFTADVPESVSNVTFYRSLAAGDPESGWNPIYNLTVSKTNNCIELTQPEQKLQASVKPYVAEAIPSFSIDRIYVENDRNWQEVYIYGYGYDLNGCFAMTHIDGTDIWYYDLPTTIHGSTGEFLIFKPQGGTGDNDWSGQTRNLGIVEPNNCYKLSGTWTTYTE